jgi:hypothetical protein
MFASFARAEIRCRVTQGGEDGRWHADVGDEETAHLSSVAHPGLRGSQREQWMYRHVPGTRRIRRAEIYLRQEMLAIGLLGKAGWMLRGATRMATDSLEQQVADVDLVTDRIDHLGQRSPGATVDVRPEVAARSYAELQQRMDDTVWSSGCGSWYLNDDGRNELLWPGFTTEYWRRTRRFDPTDYLLE